jgi:hypothetical protein
MILWLQRLICRTQSLSLLCERKASEKLKYRAQDPRNAAQLAHIRAELNRVAPPQRQRLLWLSRRGPITRLITTVLCGRADDLRVVFIAVT